MVWSGAWEKLIHEENLKSKILWHCPFYTKWLYPKILYLEADEVGSVVDPGGG